LDAFATSGRWGTEGKKGNSVVAKAEKEDRRCIDGELQEDNAYTQSHSWTADRAESEEGEESLGGRGRGC